MTCADCVGIGAAPQPARVSATKKGLRRVRDGIGSAWHHVWGKRGDEQNSSGCACAADNEEEAELAEETRDGGKEIQDEYLGLV